MEAVFNGCCLAGVSTGQSKMRKRGLDFEVYAM